MLKNHHKIRIIKMIVLIKIFLEMLQVDKRISKIKSRIPKDKCNGASAIKISKNFTNDLWFEQ